MSEPVEPSGVRLVDEAGREWPVALSYDGVGRGGQHQWVAVTPDPFVAAGHRVMELRVDVLPARTGISVAVDLP